MTTFLIFIVVLLGILAFARLIKVFELASTLKKDEDPGVVPPREIKANAMGWLLFLGLFMAFCVWQMVEFVPFLLPESASEHGVELDWLMNFNMLVIAVVFVITHILLFVFAWKYQYRADRKAEYFTHSNKLELIWTIVPAIFLAVVIVYGLTSWNNIMAPAGDDAVKVELYSKQFQWLARYPGPDGEYGDTYYKYCVTNKRTFEKVDPATGKMVEVEEVLWKGNDIALSPFDSKAMDDVVVDTEFHLPIGKEIDFQFRSQDVIHSAYMPHFRAQMNTVPGMVTKFKFKPTITTAEMREKIGDPEFHYVLICNKICGASHYNMKMNIIVESEEEYNAWMAQQTGAQERYQWASLPATNEEAATQMAENVDQQN